MHGSKCTKRISILGATGSIGQSTLDVVRHTNGAGEWEIKISALAAGRNIDLLAAQAKQFSAEFVATSEENLYTDLKDKLAGSNIQVAAGPEAVVEAAQYSTDCVVAAITGAAGVRPTIAAAKAGADIALANKECLVCAGDALLQAVALGGGRLLPVDSEHNAIFQVYDFERPHRVSQLVLTASGGPFLKMNRPQMAHVTRAQALAHPNWSMGAKISIDSATMMNKGLELIEAARLFPTAEERIRILVHPQSVVHSMVEYVDGSVLAQMGTPDMRTPIACALAWPDRLETPTPPLELDKIGTLTFEAPDMVKFPALRLARAALRAGGLMTTRLNAANEEAVAAFLDGRIGFLDITSVSEDVLAQSDKMRHFSATSLEDVLAVDHVARLEARKVITKLTN